MPVHKPHRKPILAKKARKPRVIRWLLKLDKIFIEIKLKRKVKE